MMKVYLRLFWLLLAVLAAGVGGVGCKSTESENLSSKPWNAPRGWENGLPTSINEGR